MVDVYLTAMDPHQTRLQQGWNGAFKAVKHLNHYLRMRVIPAYEAVPTPTETQQTMYLLFLRYFMWSQSAELLQSPVHLQALQTALRADLEIIVDMIYLLEDESGTATQQMKAWENAKRLEHVRKLVKFCEDKGVDPAQEHDVEMAFVAREGADIDRERGLFYELGKKLPDRWTKKNLAQDSEAADGLSGKKWELEKFYQVDYRQVCWHVHASSAITARRMSKEAAISVCVLSITQHIKFGMGIIELMLNGMGSLDAAAQQQLQMLDLEIMSLFTGVPLPA